MMTMTTEKFEIITQRGYRGKWRTVRPYPFSALVVIKCTNRMHYFAAALEDAESYVREIFYSLSKGIFHNPEMQDDFNKFGFNGFEVTYSGKSKSYYKRDLNPTEHVKYMRIRAVAEDKIIKLYYAYVNRYNIRHDYIYNKYILSNTKARHERKRETT